jgi:hypothetical protein
LPHSLPPKPASVHRCEDRICPPNASGRPASRLWRNRVGLLTHAPWLVPRCGLGRPWARWRCCPVKSEDNCFSLQQLLPPPRYLSYRTDMTVAPIPRSGDPGSEASAMVLGAAKLVVPALAAQDPAKVTTRRKWCRHRTAKLPWTDPKGTRPHDDHRTGDAATRRGECAATTLSFRARPRPGNVHVSSSHRCPAGLQAPLESVRLPATLRSSP